MIVGVRRALSGLVVGVVVSLGAAPVLPALAETATPTPSATAEATVKATSTASAVGEASSPTTTSDTPDVAPDNSRQVWVLGGAGVVALIAAAVVFLRRR